MPERKGVDLKSPYIEIVYADDDLLVVNKPSGVLSSPGKTQDNSVFTRVLESDQRVSGPVLVHRLDMDTSGLMLLAKNRANHKHLQQQFEKRRVRKRYRARLSAPAQALGGRIHLPLRLDIDNRPMQIVCDQYGKVSTTLWHRCSSSNNCDIALYPLTGRTHQLRVHLSSSRGLGIPIMGDRLYGADSTYAVQKLTPGFQTLTSAGIRLMLHADYLEFLHPQTEQTMRISCPAPF